jgi:phage gpG-like protein
MGVKVVARPGPLARALEGGIPEAMRRAAAYLQSSADRKIKTGVPPANSPLTASIKRGNLTLRDTNSLAASIAPHSGASWADASTNKRQARILQEGGVIRPTKAKALWIPAGPETRRLMTRYGAASPARLIAAMRADGYGFFKRPDSKIFSAYKKSMAKGEGKNLTLRKNAKVFALFIVRASVTIPARPFLYIDGHDMGNLMAIITLGIEKKIKEKWGKKK